MMPRSRTTQRLLTAMGALMMSSYAVSAPDYALKIKPHEYKASGDQRIDAELGHFTVLEDRTKPDGRTLRLAFVRFKSTAENPGPPIIYLAGGPGGSGIESARGARLPLFLAMREFGDVIAFDQRGTGQSEPNLNSTSMHAFPADRAVTREEAAAVYAEKARLCAGHFKGKGIDLGAYNTIENAHDVNDLRAALGAEKVMLWGTSYGTHLAFAYIRYHGETVERTILHGTEGPDHTDKLPSSTQKQLELIHELVADDPAWNKQLPDFLGSVKTVLDRFSDGPISAPVLGPDGAKRGDVVIGLFEVQQILSESIGHRGPIQSLPRIIHAMEQGDYSVIAGPAMGNRRIFAIPGMAFAMDAASGATKERQDRIAAEAKTCLLSDAINFPMPEIRAAMGVPDLGDAFRGPLQSDVPALFISGTLDGRTRPENAEEMLEGFPNGEHVLIENVGHGDDLFVASPDVLTGMQAFMRGEKVPTTRIKTEFAFLPPE